jgi:hypothetical protein
MRRRNLTITEANNKWQEIYDKVGNRWKKDDDHHQGKLQIIKKKLASPKSTIDEKKETTITKANNKSKEGNDHHYGQ